MRAAALVCKGGVAEVSAWDSDDARDGPLVVAGAAVLSREDGRVLGAPGDVVAADGLVAVLEHEVVGVAKGGGGVDAGN